MKEVVPKLEETSIGKPGKTHRDDKKGDNVTDGINDKGDNDGQNKSEDHDPAGRDKFGQSDKKTVKQRKKMSDITMSSVRNIVRNKTCGEYTIIFTPGSSAEGVLEVFMSAESQNYEAPIIAVSCNECPDLEFDKNKITNLVFTKNQPLRINIQLDYHDYCSLEVKAYGN